MISLEDIKEIFKGKSIAVVGNSVSSLTQLNGAAIDAHDLIMRCNRGFLKCNKKTLGLRTDGLILGSPGRDNPANYTQLNLPSLRCIIWTKTVESAQRLPKVIKKHPRLFYYDQKMRWNLRNRFNDWWPTSGLMMFELIYRETDFRGIDLYGFDFFRTGTTYSGLNRAGKWHDPPAERQYIYEIIGNDSRVTITGDIGHGK